MLVSYPSHRYALFNVKNHARRTVGGHDVLKPMMKWLACVNTASLILGKTAKKLHFKCFLRLVLIVAEIILSDNVFIF